LRAFASGTSLVRRAGLMGDHYLAIALDLRVNSPAERDQALSAIDAKVLPLGASGHPFTAVRRVGSPWLDAWLERQTGESTKKFMPLFGIFLLTLVFILYRSWRALAAIILTLGAVVAMAVGLGELLGFSNSVVSTLVPLTVMVTTTATLVYIHSRYMEPDAAPPLEHHARALANKFLPCTASMFATAVGFAALAVSDIRPVREMGLWTACGLIAAWVGCFTLFPALQSLLRAPRRSSAATDDKWFAKLVEVLVPATRRYRWFLVIGAVLIMLCAAARDRRADLRQSARARGAGYAPIRAGEWLGRAGLVAADATRPGARSGVSAQRALAGTSARTASRDQCRRRTHHTAALGTLYPIRLR